MTLTPPRPPSECPDSQEALSRFHSLDTFAARFLTSGRIALYTRQGDLLGLADNERDMLVAVDHLRLAADRARQQAEAARFALEARAAEAKALDELELEL